MILCVGATPFKILSVFNGTKVTVLSVLQGMLNLLISSEIDQERSTTSGIKKERKSQAQSWRTRKGLVSELKGRHCGTF